MRQFGLLCVLLMVCGITVAQTLDSDRDGLSDSLEDSLLQRFSPRLMVSADDCSTLPATFAGGILKPTPIAEDGTLYGQATPRTVNGRASIELHFYHLWRSDCGRLGHPLDTEHVSALLQADAKGDEADAGAWHAVYWYAAAHEDTVCDASQLTRASTLRAEDHGAEIWVSGGKHASFLAKELCHHGCGGDQCVHAAAAPQRTVVNLGELRYPMNGAAWVLSAEWPLADKVARSDFAGPRLQRLLRLPQTDIAWAKPEDRPAQSAILGGNAAVNGAITGARSTDTALVLAGHGTGGALGTAVHGTGNALGRSAHAVKKALSRPRRVQATGASAAQEPQ